VALCPIGGGTIPARLVAPIKYCQSENGVFAEGSRLSEATLPRARSNILGALRYDPRTHPSFLCRPPGAAQAPSTAHRSQWRGCKLLSTRRWLKAWIFIIAWQTACLEGLRVYHYELEDFSIVI